MSKLGKAKDVITGHYFSYKTFIILLAILGGSLYVTWALSRDRIMELWLTPAYETIHTTPLIGPAIDWIGTYTASWRWDQIILSTMMLCLGAFVGWFYGKPRTETLEIDPTPEKTPKPEPEPVTKKTYTSDEVAAMIKKLEADAEKAKEQAA